jgi:hypothetical protein
VGTALEEVILVAGRPIAGANVAFLVERDAAEPPVAGAGAAELVREGVIELLFLDAAEPVRGDAIGPPGKAEPGVDVVEPLVVCDANLPPGKTAASKAVVVSVGGTYGSLPIAVSI